MKIYVVDDYSGYKGIVKVRKKKYHTPLEELRIYEECYFYHNYNGAVKSIERHTGVSYIDCESYHKGGRMGITWLHNDVFGKGKTITFFYVR